MYRFLFVSIFTALVAQAHASSYTPQTTMTPIAQQNTDAQLAQKHPSELYLYAKQLFDAGRKDDAVTWFYIGQLRWRYHLQVSPDLPPDGEPAAMNALNATLGQTFNEWAGGSPKAWRASIAKALAWDAANPNPTTPKEKHPTEWQQTRAGLMQLDSYIRDNAAQIRAERQARGLENR